MSVHPPSFAIMTYMKKLLLSIVVSVSSLSAFADYTAENKIIKVVIPQPPASGLGSLYNHVATYARKQNITMVPIYKPGANGKLGIAHATTEKNLDDTILFSTISDFVGSEQTDKFENISLVSKVTLTLVASKRSKIKSTSDLGYKEITWGYFASGDKAVIDTMQEHDILPVRFSAGYQMITSVVNGDIDLAFAQPDAAETLAAKDMLTIVDIDKKSKKKMQTKENASAFFLSKEASAEAITYWQHFTEGLLQDSEFKKGINSLVREDVEPGPKEMKKVLKNWGI